MLTTRKILLFIILFLSFVGVTNAWGIGDIINTNDPEVIYCKNNDCGLDEGINEVKDIGGFVNDQKASEYFQSVMNYLLTFIYLLAVILIIYSGFNLITGVGEEEKATKSKTMIVYVIIGILIIFLAKPIVGFILEVLTQA